MLGLSFLFEVLFALGRTRVLRGIVCLWNVLPSLVPGSFWF